MKKTILITGSTDGIGKLAAILLAKDGHTVYLHGRNAEKLAGVISEIKTLSNKEDIDGFVADFSDLAAVKKMAQHIQEKLSSIDVLINNAGVFKSPIAHTKEGLDIRYAVNYLAPYVLTQELMPLLQKGATPRIINLSSAAQASISQAVMMGDTVSTPMEAYAQSKLALTMWSFDLAKKQQEITVIPVNPGSLLNTNMVREAFGQSRSSADKGAKILYGLAVSEKYQGHTGEYFDNDRGSFGPAHPDAYEQAELDKLMKMTAGVLGN